MSRLYAREGAIYDLTRRLLLFGRQRLIRTLAPEPGERVLDIGCGTGSALPTLAAAVAPDGQVVAIDCATPLVTRAMRRTSGLPAVQVRPAEFRTINWRGERFDVIHCSYTLTMMPDWREALELARSLLTPRGRLGVVDFGAPPPNPLRRAFEAHGVRFEPDLPRTLRAGAVTLRQEYHRAYGVLWPWFLWTGDPRLSQQRNVLPLSAGPA